MEQTKKKKKKKKRNHIIDTTSVEKKKNQTNEHILINSQKIQSKIKGSQLFVFPHSTQ